MKQQCIPDGFPKSKITLVINYRKILHIVFVSANNPQRKNVYCVLLVIRREKYFILSKHPNCITSWNALVIKPFPQLDLFKNFTGL